MNHSLSAVTIKQWAAWSPGLHTPDAWQFWATAVETDSAHAWAPLTSQEQAMPLDELSLNAIPPAIRRHASSTSKMALATSLTLIANGPVDYAIFTSQHGELQRSMGLLTDIAAKALLSPLGFTHSVHNIAVGLFAIVAQLQINTTAMAAGAHSFTMGMVEAMVWLQLNPGKTVLVTMYDEAVPDLYKALCTGCDIPYVLALLLTTADSEGGAIQATIVNDSSQQPNPGTARRAPTPSAIDCNPDDLPIAPTENEALAFLAWLLNPEKPAFMQTFHGQAIHWTEQSL